MNINLRFDDILEESYSDYSNEYTKDNTIGMTMLVKLLDGTTMYRKPNIEMFEGIIEADEGFANRWKTKIESRQMTWEESVQWVMKNTNVEWENLYIVEEVYKKTTPNIIKTISYNNKTAIKYEYGR